MSQLQCICAAAVGCANQRAQLGVIVPEQVPWERTAGMQMVKEMEGVVM